MRQNLIWEDVYSPAYNVNRLQPTQKNEYRKHQLLNYPVFAAVILHFMTLGIFDILYYGAMHAKLPFIRHDDPTQAQAISYWFIPFFDIYWGLFFYVRLVDRINFQFRLRNQPPPVPKGLFTVSYSLYLGSLFFFLLAAVLSVSSNVDMLIVVGSSLFAIFFCILQPIAIAILQSNCNKLANEQVYVENVGKKPPVVIVR